MTNINIENKRLIEQYINNKIWQDLISETHFKKINLTMKKLKYGVENNYFIINRNFFKKNLQE